MATVEARVREIAERVARDYGLEIVDVELKGGGKARMLRITIDRDAPVEAAGAAPIGVTHDDCSNVSREVSTILDVEDAVPGASYTLEVTSPGLDRRLVRPRDWERFVGSRVRLVTREAIDGQKAFDGRLEAVRNGRATLELKLGGGKKQKKHAAEHESHKVEIDLANVDRAHLVPEF